MDMVDLPLDERERAPVDGGVPVVVVWVQRVAVLVSLHTPLRGWTSLPYYGTVLVSPIPCFSTVSGGKTRMDGVRRDMEGG